MGLWDRLYYYDNDSIKYEVPIDMKGNMIKGVGDGDENGDAVNVKQLNEAKANYNNNIFIRLILNYILKDENKFPLFKELYFPDSIEFIYPPGPPPNINYLLYTKPIDSEDQITVYHVFQHNSSTSNSMIIWFSYVGGVDINNMYFNVYKNKVNINRAENIDTTFNIPNNCLGKQLWFWIWINNNYLNVIFSGLSPKKFNFTTGLKNLTAIRVSNTNIFPRVRGLMTKNIYDNKSEVYNLIKRFEEDEGTIT